MKPLVYIFFPIALSLSQPLLASEQQPPPPLGPPEASPTTPTQLASVLIRNEVQRAAEQAMTEHNDGDPNVAGDGSPHKLSWASNAEPLLCDHCVLGPYMSVTDRPDRPNERVARMSFRLAMDLDVNNLPGDRRVITPVDVTVRCAGFGSGAGELRMTTRTGVPYLDGTSLLEDIVDFFSPWDLSQFVDNKIKAQLSSGSVGQNTQGPCVSLGVYEDQNPLFDAVLWEAPANQQVMSALAGATVANTNIGKVTVVLKEIRRLATPLVADTSAPVSFDIYVNGNWVDLGSAQTATIPVEGSVPVAADRIIIPSAGLDAVQVIFATSIGGASWQQFSRAQNFGKGDQALKSHRHAYLHLPQGGPKPNKPVPTDIREFELVYEILRFEPSFVLANP